MDAWVAYERVSAYQEGHVDITTARNPNEICQLPGHLTPPLI